MSRKPLLSLFAVFMLLACSSTEPNQQSSGSTASGGETISCESETRDVYVANLQKIGRGGVLTFVLAESTPAPPSRGRNTWLLKVSDARGNALESAKLTLSAVMPAHGHSSPTVPTVTAQPGGGYSVGPISLFMPGLWEVTIDAEHGGTRDSATFAFCVAG